MHYNPETHAVRKQRRGQKCFADPKTPFFPPVCFCFVRFRKEKAQPSADIAALQKCFIIFLQARHRRTLFLRNRDRRIGTVPLSDRQNRSSECRRRASVRNRSLFADIDKPQMKSRGKILQVCVCDAYPERIRDIQSLIAHPVNIV